MEDYERKERFKLAETVEMDIFAWEDFLMLTTGGTRDEVAEELGRANIYDKRTFRHLDIATKEREYALDLLNHASKSCASDLVHLGGSLWSFTDADAVDLLDYCEQAWLGLFMNALSGMVAIGDEEYRRNFRRVQKYTNLKNVLNSYEYILNRDSPYGQSPSSKGISKRDGGIIVRSCKASQSPVYPIRDAILAVNHASCPSLSSSGPTPMG